MVYVIRKYKKTLRQAQRERAGDIVYKILVLNSFVITLCLHKKDYIISSVRVAMSRRATSLRLRFKLRRTRSTNGGSAQ